MKSQVCGTRLIPNPPKKAKRSATSICKIVETLPGKSDFRVKAACWKGIKALFALPTPPPPFNVVPCYFD